MIYKDYRVRLFIVFCAFGFVYLVLVARLFFIQIYYKDFFVNLAHGQHHVAVSISPARGAIYDRFKDRPLTFNNETLSAFILPHELSEKEKTCAYLKRSYPEVFDRMIKFPQRHFLWLDRHLPEERLTYLRGKKLKDINFIAEPQRYYPVESLAHVLGFTDIDNNGIAGIEQEFNKHLSGASSFLEMERDARSGCFYFEKNVNKQGELGLPVVLTIDSALQSFAYEELKETVLRHRAKTGSVLVMDPDSGEILTMANYPSFNPSEKKTNLNLEVTKNNVVSECYELGSVFKIFTALAALEEELVTPDDLIDCEGKVTFIDGIRVENWKSVNVVPFSDVVRYSSNVGIAKVAKLLGPRLHHYLRLLGFGKKTGIRFPGERDGFVNPPERWSKPSLIVLAFGYEIMASLLQLGSAFSIIANGGYSVKPSLVIDPPQEPWQKTKLLSDRTIEQIKDIMEKIGERYKISGYRVMGKTGTARCVKDGVYSTKAHLYTFAGIVEKGDYKRVIVTFIKEPERAHMWASEVTAPLFRRVAERMVILDTTRRGKKLKP